MGACCTSASAQVIPEPAAPENGYIPEPRHCMSFSTFFVQEEQPQIGDWIFTNEIGRGARSHVYSVKSAETGDIFAAKVYNKAHLRKQTLGSAERPIDQVMREIHVMERLQHDYLLQLLEAFEDDGTDGLFLITPLAIDGSVESLVESNKISIDRLAVCFYQVAQGLRHMHSLNIVHRDVKPENILSFGPGCYVLSDFSVSMELESEDQMLVDTKGSPAFLSPEECSGKPFRGKPADVWAFGISVFACVFRQLPFDMDADQGATVANAMMRVTEVLATKELEFPKDQKVDPNLKALIEGCLKKDPAERLTFEEIVKNEWFKEGRQIEAEVHKWMEEEDDE